MLVQIKTIGEEEAMDFSRRTALALTLAGLGSAGTIRTSRAAVEIGDDGLHKQSWFIESFLDLAEDHADAAAEGKGLAIMIEQRGCPYCREMHEVNLAKPEIAEYIQEHFNVLQLDMWGARELTDFDGSVDEERALIRSWAVNFTPTVLLFAKDADVSSGKPAGQIASAIMPGYFKPFHFHAMFEFVAKERFKDTTFQYYIQERADAMRAKGIKVDIW